MGVAVEEGVADVLAECLCSPAVLTASLIPPPLERYLASRDGPCSAALAALRSTDRDHEGRAVLTEAHALR